MLTEYENSLRSISTGELLDTCKKCLKGLDIQYRSNGFYIEEEIVDDDLEQYTDSYDDIYIEDIEDDE
jgi:hypothetical protein